MKGVRRSALPRLRRGFLPPPQAGEGRGRADEVIE